MYNNDERRRLTFYCKKRNRRNIRRNRANTTFYKKMFLWRHFCSYGNWCRGITLFIRCLEWNIFLFVVRIPFFFKIFSRRISSRSFWVTSIPNTYFNTSRLRIKVIETKITLIAMYARLLAIFWRRTIKIPSFHNVFPMYHINIRIYNSEILIDKHLCSNMSHFRRNWSCVHNEFLYVLQYNYI